MAGPAVALGGTGVDPGNNTPLFPLFQARFFFGWDLGSNQPGAAQRQQAEGCAMSGATGTSGQGNRPALKTLDLGALAGTKDDGLPSETQLRRQKYQFFEKQCSEILPGLYLAGDYVARNREILQQHGITHVINCVGFICKEYFQGELEYLTYYLQDTPAEDILCLLYLTFEFIEQAISSGGRVLVHCSQGVSRSATIVIAYLMWKAQKNYDEAYAHVKAARGVANPNIGFTCQLLQWQKRRYAPPARLRMYRIAPHCQHAPLLLVPRLVAPPRGFPTHTWRSLDPRGAFVIQAPNCLYVWVGAKCPPTFAEAAEATAHVLPKYEATSSSRVEVQHQGQETPQFLSIMDPPELDEDGEHGGLARYSSVTGDMLSTCSLPSVHDADGASQPSHSRLPSVAHSRHNSRGDARHLHHSTLPPEFAAAQGLPPHMLSQAAHHPSSPSRAHQLQQQHPLRHASSPLPPAFPPSQHPMQGHTLYSQSSLQPSRLPQQHQHQHQHYQQDGWRNPREGNAGSSHSTGDLLSRPPRLSLPGGMHLPELLPHPHPHPFFQQQQQQQQQEHYSEGHAQAPMHPSLLSTHEEGAEQAQQEDAVMDVGHEEGVQGTTMGGASLGSTQHTDSTAPLSPMPITPGPLALTEALMRQEAKGPGRPQSSHSWQAREVDEYTADFQMYWEAARSTFGSSGGESARHLGNSSSMGKEQERRAMRASMGGNLGIGSYVHHRAIGMGGDDMMHGSGVNEDDFMVDNVSAVMSEDRDVLMSSVHGGGGSGLAGFYSAELSDPQRAQSPSRTHNMLPALHPSPGRGQS